MNKTAVWTSAILAGTLATGTVVYASTRNSDAHGTVTRVVDGDTVDMSIAGKETRVRLLNIDTPETVDPNKPVECMGPEASEHLKSLLHAGDKVDLKYDVEREDRYGRTLAAVYKDDEFINRAIAAAGMGIAVKFEPNTRFYQEILDAQRSAERNASGLFSTQIACTIPAQVTESLETMNQVPSASASTVEEAKSFAEEAALAVAAGVAVNKALELITPESHPVTAALLATTFKNSAAEVRESTDKTERLANKHRERLDDLIAKEEQRKAAEAKAKREAEEARKAKEIAKREAEQRAAETREAAQREARQKAAQRPTTTAPKYNRPKYVAPKPKAPKVQSPRKQSVPENYNGPRCYAPGGKTWKPCG